MTLYQDEEMNLGGHARAKMLRGSFGRRSSVQVSIKCHRLVNRVFHHGQTQQAKLFLAKVLPGSNRFN